MSLPDGAEYWWDVKRNYSYCGPYYTHFPNSTCGHLGRSSGNTRTSEWLNDVDCPACLKIIKANGNIYGLKEGMSPKEQSRADKEKNRLKKLFRFGKCNCGRPMCERVNRSTGNKFLGCTGYPKCKNTMSIKTIEP